MKGQLVTNLGITPPDCRAPHGSQPITSYEMPPAIAPGRVASEGQGAHGRAQLAAPKRRGAEGKGRAASDPASPTYRQWLTPAELEADYLPPASDFTTLKAWATSKGLQVSSQPSHRVAGLVGTVAQIERALFVNLITARRPDGTVFYGPDRRPRSIWFRWCRASRVSTTSRRLTVAAAAAGRRRSAAPQAPSNRTTFATRYLGQAPSSCAALTGAGQSIGVFAYGRASTRVTLTPT